MEAAQNKIALIYFSRRANRESFFKHWFPHSGNAKNRTLAANLVNHSYQAIRNTGYPIFHFHEGNQTGKTFGERLTNAYHKVFNLGYEAVIAVGNDSPEIATINWADIDDQLRSGNCVIGPSIRGGAYLIGLTRNAFDKQAFERLPWQTNNLFGTLSEFLANAGQKKYLLKKLRDINSFYDLKKIVNIPDLENSLKKFILQLFSNSKHTAWTIRLFPQFPIIQILSPRGPPLHACFNF